LYFSTTTIVKIFNCTFYDNMAEEGGAIYVFDEGDILIDNCNFIRNWANSHGGAVGFLSSKFK